MKESKDKAAQEAGFLNFDQAYREISKVQSHSNRLERLDIVYNRAMEIYAEQKAVEFAEWASRRADRFFKTTEQMYKEFNK